jgi:hypothetical protein
MVGLDMSHPSTVYSPPEIGDILFINPFKTEMIPEEGRSLSSLMYSHSTVFLYVCGDNAEPTHTCSHLISKSY